MAAAAALAAAALAAAAAAVADAAAAVADTAWASVAAAASTAACSVPANSPTACFSEVPMSDSWAMWPVAAVAPCTAARGASTCQCLLHVAAPCMHEGLPDFPMT